MEQSRLQALGKDSMNKRRISAQSIAQDIRAGLTDAELQEKYRVRHDALHYLMNRLVDAGVITDFELFGRKSLSESDLMRAFSPSDQAILKCPFCGNVIPEETVGCTTCQSLATEFEDTLVIEPVIESTEPTMARPDSTVGRQVEQTEEDLIDACREGRTELVRQLLSRDVDVNCSDDSGVTPLMGAAFEGRTEVAELLLRRQADVNVKDKSGQTALGHAAAKGHIQLMRILLEKGAHLPTVVMPLGASIAAETAADRGNHLDDPPSNGESPKAESQYVPADPLMVPPETSGPVEVLTDIADEIQNGEDSNRKALLKAASRGLVESVEGLLNRGLDVNSRSKYGNTALIRAAFKGHVDVARLLLERNADVNAQNSAGNTALTVAIEAGHAEIVELLLRNGANACAKTVDGSTALVVACLSENRGVVNLLINHGADVNQSNSDGDTPLMRACDRGHAPIVEDLIRAGADVNVANKHGNTGLMKAAFKGYEAVVKILLRAGAHVNVKNDYGNTALMKACHEGHVEVARLLLKAGAEVDAQDRDGRTAMIRAKKSGRQELVDLLVRYRLLTIDPL